MNGYYLAIGFGLICCVFAVLGLMIEQRLSEVKDELYDMRALLDKERRYNGGMYQKREPKTYEPFWAGVTGKVK